MPRRGTRADWLDGAADPGGIADLVIRRKWSKAIEILRGHLLEGHVPSVQGRLQLAHLMVMAGRGTEAVPVLLGLADELAADHFVAKAIAILKRVEKLDPGRPDVAERLGLLARTQSRLAGGVTVPPPRAPSFDMEELDDVGDLADAVPAGTCEGAPGAAGPAPGGRAGPERNQAASQRKDGEIETPRGDEGPASVPEGGANLERQTSAGVGERLRRVLRRVLGLPESGRTEESVERARGASPRLAESSGDAGESAPEIREAVRPPAENASGTPDVMEAEARVAERLGPGAVLNESAGTEPVEVEIVELEEAPETDAIGEAGFRQRVLDLVQDVLRHPPARAHPEPEAVPAAGLTARLVAVPLFGGLSSEELLAVVHGLALRTFEPGDALVTEGETGRSLFILTSGRGKVFVRSRDGHSVEVGRVAEGDFFGEISALSGSPRGATVTAAEACEALELEREALDAIALAHPRVRETLEASYLAHAGDPDAAAVRAVDLRDRHAPRRALEILETRFGESHWTPRMRLRLADVLAKAGHYDDAVPVLVSLADDLVRNGRPEKAIAIVKKIERIQQRDVAELPLVPLARGGREAGGRTAPSASEKARARDGVEADTRADGLEEWLIRLAREAVRGRESAPPGGTEGREPPPGYGPGLRSSALFEDFSDAELLALVGGLRLVCHGPGDIIVSEGEPGESVYVVATGTVKVLVRDPLGRSVAVCHLGEGSFFGEIAALSGRPRSATVIAAESCELLELDRSALDVISAQHPRVREVLERAYLERASDPAAEHARTVARG